MLGVVGDLVEDVVVWLREPVQPATDTAARVFRRRGGSAANVAAFAAARHPTRFIGCVGQDAIGDTLTAELRSQGVDMRVQRYGVTGTIVVLIDEDGERTMFPDRGAALHLTDVEPAWTDDLEHLHAPAYSLVDEPIGSTTAELIARVRQHGASVSIDPSSSGVLRRYGRERFLRLVAALQPELLFPNRDEADYLELIHEGRPGSAIADLPQTTVVVKNGAQPTLVLCAGREPLEVPAPTVKDVRDMTGAGDAFAAGFLTAFLADPDLRSACESGHAMAGRILQTPGASLDPP